MYDNMVVYRFCGRWENLLVGVGSGTGIVDGFEFVVDRLLCGSRGVMHVSQVLGKVCWATPWANGCLVDRGR